MSTASPFKHDRIERHIQRQRGAGVRTLATSFGFSFGLSTALPAAATAVDSSHPEEPPTKRRKSREPGGNVALLTPHVRNKSHHGVHERLPPVDAPIEMRRRLEDVQEELGSGPSTKADKDTLVKTVRMRGRLRKVVAESGAIHKPEIVTKPAAKKRGRPKKVQTTEHTVDQDVAAKEDAGLNIAVVAARVAMTSAVNTAAAHTSPAKPRAKTRGRPKKKAADGEHEENLGQALHANCLPPSRPKRQAATAAMTKVSEGFLEEECDITKKRRDVPTSMKPAAKITEEMSDRRAEPPVKVAEKRAAKPAKTKTSTKTRASIIDPVMGISPAGVESCENVDACTERAALEAGQVAPPARPKRRAAIAAKAKVIDGYIEEASDISKKRRGSSTHAHKSGELKSVSGAAASLGSTTHEVSHMSHATKQDQVVIKPKRRKQGQVELAKPAPVVRIERIPLIEAGVNIRRPSSPQKATQEPAKSPTKLPALQPTADPAVIRTSHTHIPDVKKRKAGSITVACEPAGARAVSHGSMKPRDIGIRLISAQGRGTLVDDTAARRTTKSCSETQGSKQMVMPATRAQLNPEEQIQKLQDSEKPHSEDVDWLFDRSTTRSTVTRRTQAVKNNRRVVSAAPDVDLDDLLSNIANFVPRAATSGRSGSRRG